MLTDRTEIQAAHYDSTAKQLTVQATYGLGQFLRRRYPVLQINQEAMFHPDEIFLLPKTVFDAVVWPAVTVRPGEWTVSCENRMTLQITRSGKALYGVLENYQFPTGDAAHRALAEATLAEEILGMSIPYWPRAQKLASLPAALQWEMDQCYEALLSARWSVSLEVGVPARQYRKVLAAKRFIDVPRADIADIIVVAGTRVHLCYMEANERLKSEVALGVAFDRLVAKCLIQKPLGKEFILDYVGRENEEFTRQTDQRDIWRVNFPCAPAGPELGWISRIAAKLGFKPDPVRGRLPLYKAYFSGEIGRAVLRELERPHGALTLQDYLAPPPSSK